MEKEYQWKLDNVLNWKNQKIPQMKTHGMLPKNYLRGKFVALNTTKESLNTNKLSIFFKKLEDE